MERTRRKRVLFLCAGINTYTHERERESSLCAGINTYTHARERERESSLFAGIHIERELFARRHKAINTYSQTLRGRER